jgi:cell division protein FtsL
MARRAATAVATRAPARPAPAPAPRARPARRTSGPAVRGGAVALPGRLKARARGGALLDTLLYGRAWIALVGVLLVGIVFFNVDLLQLNRQIARTTARSADMRQQNAHLRLELARLASSERIQQAAADRGLLLPAPGDVRYLRANPSVDGRRAARRATQPRGVVLSAPAPAAPQPAPTAQPAPTPQAQAPQAQAPPVPAQPQAAPGAGAPAG